VSARGLVWTYFSCLVATAGATVFLLGAILLHFLPHNYLNKIGLDCARLSGCATLPIWLNNTITFLVGGALLGLLAVASLTLVNGLTGSRRLSLSVARARRPAIDLIPPHLRSITCVVDDPVPLSYALGGPRECIVVSNGMLKALEPAEIEAVFAHEEAHLLAHDGFLILIGQTIACSMAVVPGVRLAFARMRHAQEIVADKHACNVVGDPLIVASGLQKFARCLIAPTIPSPAFVQQGGGVAERIQDLLRSGVSKTSRRRLVLATLLSFAVLASFASSAMAYTAVTRTTGRSCSACTHVSAHAVAAQHPAAQPGCASSH
jgi:Zn-dependent protease with chaperone function